MQKRNPRRTSEYSKSDHGNGADKRWSCRHTLLEEAGSVSVCLTGIEVDFSGESNTLIVRNMDRPGCITEVSAALSREKINVATMQVFRHKRGGLAVMVVETDQPYRKTLWLN